MNKNDCVVDVGQCFTVEWFFDEKGYSQPFEYFLQSPQDQKRKLLLLVRKIAEFGKIMDITKFRNEDDGIYAFKPQPDRYMSFFMKGKKIIITNAFYKNTDKLPKAEKERALAHMASYTKRTQEGTYYVE